MVWVYDLSSPPILQKYACLVQKNAVNDIPKFRPKKGRVDHKLWLVGKGLWSTWSFMFFVCLFVVLEGFSNLTLPFFGFASGVLFCTFWFCIGQQTHPTNQKIQDKNNLFVFQFLILWGEVWQNKSQTQTQSPKNVPFQIYFLGFLLFVSFSSFLLLLFSSFFYSSPCLLCGDAKRLFLLNWELVEIKRREKKDRRQEKRKKEEKRRQEKQGKNRRERRRQEEKREKRITTNKTYRKMEVDHKHKPGKRGRS